MEIGTEKKKIGLSTQIFIALLAGALLAGVRQYVYRRYQDAGKSRR